MDAEDHEDWTASVLQPAEALPLPFRADAVISWRKDRVSP
ncbi:hypothetical protein RK21_05041 [Pseudomonas plecoglossicida]|nr:hypothetical protein RK21_05041 [Pseudomonas plecoglossicida]